MEITTVSIGFQYSACGEETVGLKIIGGPQGRINAFEIGNICKVMIAGQI